MTTPVFILGLQRSGTTWLGNLLAAHPTLMKRPVIEVDGVWTIGWKADVQSRYLGE